MKKPNISNDGFAYFQKPNGEAGIIIMRHLNTSHYVMEVPGANADEKLANAKFLSASQVMAGALLEARRVCKRQLEMTEYPNIPDEHEFALEKIEDALERAGYEL